MTAPPVSTSSSFPHVGSIFQDRYRLDQVIGQGGYARVYRAKQTDLGRDVAIKILRTQYRNAQKAEEAARRFEREAKLVSQLRDPHTLTVYDYGRTDNGTLYIVAEYVDGENLLDFVNREGALEPARAATMILGVLYSLQEAHQRGILHRDIKPANVMVYELPGRPDQVKLLDFGIAKAFEDDSEGADSMAVALTGQGRVVGSPGYMSPEQIRGAALTPASDIYSTGLVFYEMLCAQRAIDEDDLRAAFRQIDEHPIVLPEVFYVPEAYADIVHRMIDKRTEVRFSTVDEVIEALSALVKPTRVNTDELPAAPAAPPAPTLASSSDADAARRYKFLAIAAVVVGAIAAAAFIITNF